MPNDDKQKDSFIIRIWREPRELRGAPTIWRGELEHVASQKRHFFRNLGDLVALIRPYLRKMGIDPDLPAADEHHEA